MLASWLEPPSLFRLLFFFHYYRLVLIQIAHCATQPHLAVDVKTEYFPALIIVATRVHLDDIGIGVKSFRILPYDDHGKFLMPKLLKQVFPR